MKLRLPLGQYHDSTQSVLGYFDQYCAWNYNVAYVGAMRCKPLSLGLWAIHEGKFLNGLFKQTQILKSLFDFLVYIYK